MPENKYTVIITPNAQRDIYTSCSYIIDEFCAGDAALSLVEDFYSAIKRLEDFPRSCPKIMHPSLINKDMHKLLIRENYVALYIIDDIDKTVHIIGIFNTIRDYVQYLVDY